MSRTSQSLAFTIDELIKTRWVTWSEGVLSTSPDALYNTKSGFQDIVGATNGTERSRATETFRLGLIQSRLIREKTDKSKEIPLGWKNICENLSIHTYTGYIAYVLGKGLNQKPEPKRSVLIAFDSLCAIVILSIGFNFNSRWYSTANIFLFVKNKVEASLARDMSTQEARLLAGAVFNTLDYKYAGQLIDAYKNNNSSFKLHFLFRVSKHGKSSFDEANVSLFDIDSFIQEVFQSDFKIENTYRQKASYFWAVATTGRGIFTRAFRGGEEFLSRLTILDQERAKNKQDNLFQNFYLDRDQGFIKNDLVSLALSLLNEFPELNKGLIDIMKTLNQGVIESLELIKRKTEITTTDIFYLHDNIEFPEEISKFSISVPHQGLPIQPVAGNTLVLLNGEKLKIISVERFEKNFIIGLES